MYWQTGVGVTLRAFLALFDRSVWLFVTCFDRSFAHFQSSWQKTELDRFTVVSIISEQIYG
jgi:hypothetical protein